MYITKVYHYNYLPVCAKTELCVFFTAEWFEVEEAKNTNVYVTGLPLDITEEEYEEMMKKYGLIMFDPFTRKPKLKLYKDENGQCKGDALCCFIKVSALTHIC